MPEKKLADCLREAIRLRGYSIRAERDGSELVDNVELLCQIPSPVIG
jgi:hypothetical protein